LDFKTQFKGEEGLIGTNSGFYNKTNNKTKDLVNPRPQGLISLDFWQKGQFYSNGALLGIFGVSRWTQRPPNWEFWPKQVIGNGVFDGTMGGLYEGLT